jgi:hypothetical protein
VLAAARACGSRRPGRIQGGNQRRVRENPGCFEDLLGIADRSMTVEEDRDRSVRAVADAWREYEAQGRGFARSSYLAAQVPRGSQISSAPPGTEEERRVDGVLARERGPGL